LLILSTESTNTHLDRYVIIVVAVADIHEGLPHMPASCAAPLSRHLTALDLYCQLLR